MGGLAEFLLECPPEMHLAAFVLGSTRLMVFASVAPFLGFGRLDATARTALTLSLYLILHPAVLSDISGLFPLGGSGWLVMGGLLLKEIFLGFVLGWLSGLAFWAVESAGFFIDNQRGASAATMTDSFTGDETSPTGAFLMQSTIYAFFASGAFAALLAVLYSTYEFWPVSAYLPGAFFMKEGAALFFGERLAELALNIVLISAPVVLACLFADVALGLINRFAPQLNVYILAMPVKCAVASFLLIFYFAILMTDSAERFTLFGTDLTALKAFFR